MLFLNFKNIFLKFKNCMQGCLSLCELIIHLLTHSVVYSLTYLILHALKFGEIFHVKIQSLSKFSYKVW